jgi:CBS domain-containing protein
VDDYILRQRDRSFLVIEDGLVKGIVCLQDVKGIPREQWPTTAIGAIMIPQKQLEKVSPGDDASVALNKLTSKNIHQVPVVQENKVLGILRRNDILNYLQLHADVGAKSGAS